MIASKKRTDSKTLKEHKALEFSRLLKHNTKINVSTVLYSGTNCVELVMPELDCDQLIILGKFLKFSFPYEQKGENVRISSKRNLTILNIPSSYLDKWYERRENEIISILLKKIINHE
jgi:hypothetical protein